MFTNWHGKLLIGMVEDEGYLAMASGDCFGIKLYAAPRYAVLEVHC